MSLSTQKRPASVNKNMPHELEVHMGRVPFSVCREKFNLCATNIGELFDQYNVSFRHYTRKPDAAAKKKPNNIFNQFELAQLEKNICSAIGCLSETKTQKMPSTPSPDPVKKKPNGEEACWHTKLAIAYRLADSDTALKIEEQAIHKLQHGHPILATTRDKCFNILSSDIFVPKQKKYRGRMVHVRTSIRWVCCLLRQRFSSADCFKLFDFLKHERRRDEKSYCIPRGVEFTEWIVACDRLEKKLSAIDDEDEEKWKDVIKKEINLIEKKLEAYRERLQEAEQNDWTRKEALKKEEEKEANDAKQNASRGKSSTSAGDDVSSSSSCSTHEELDRQLEILLGLDEFDEEPQNLVAESQNLVVESQVPAAGTLQRLSEPSSSSSGATNLLATGDESQEFLCELIPEFLAVKDNVLVPSRFTCNNFDFSRSLNPHNVVEINPFFIISLLTFNNSIGDTKILTIKTKLNCVYDALNQQDHISELDMVSFIDRICREKERRLKPKSLKMSSNLNSSEPVSSQDSQSGGGSENGPGLSILLEHDDCVNITAEWLISKWTTDEGILAHDYEATRLVECIASMMLRANRDGGHRLKQLCDDLVEYDGVNAELAYLINPLIPRLLSTDQLLARYLKPEHPGVGPPTVEGQFTFLEDGYKLLRSCLNKDWEGASCHHEAFVDDKMDISKNVMPLYSSVRLFIEKEYIDRKCGGVGNLKNFKLGLLPNQTAAKLWYETVEPALFLLTGAKGLKDSWSKIEQSM